MTVHSRVMVRAGSVRCNPDVARQGRFPFGRLITTTTLLQVDEAAHEAESGTVLEAVLIR